MTPLQWPAPVSLSHSSVSAPLASSSVHADRSWADLVPKLLKRRWPSERPASRARFLGAKLGQPSGRIQTRAESSHSSGCAILPRGASCADADYNPFSGMCDLICVNKSSWSLLMQLLLLLLLLVSLVARAESGRPCCCPNWTAARPSHQFEPHTKASFLPGAARLACLCLR